MARRRDELRFPLRRVPRTNIMGITKPAIRRLAQRGGVKRTSRTIYEEMRGALKIFLQDVVRDAALYTQHGYRSTVTSLDILYALKRSGRTLYGFGL
ncbi:histone-fold-containing protein [Mycena rosella]|uniref:Histone H4 n=1 Tax=Mycena rosella TaxID=1033263 RepID=A0AAD7GAL3_MYCRO|nr:histone-fold-containing protein [Mycena rosella]